MPKRRVRSAAQIAASKKNLEKARRKAAQERAGRIPVGKNVLLIHRTTPEAANSIVTQQKFKPGFDRPTNRGGKRIYFTPASSRSGAKFYDGLGKAAVSVRVSRKVIKPDNWVEYKYYGAVTVDRKDLQGKKIRRHY